MDAPDEPVAQPFVFQFDMRVTLHPARHFQLVVEPLDIERGQLVQLDITDAGDDVFLDVVVVVVRRLLPDGGLGVLSTCADSRNRLLVLYVLRYRLLVYLSHCTAKISPRPHMLSPVSFPERRKFPLQQS